MAAKARSFSLALALALASPVMAGEPQTVSFPGARSTRYAAIEQVNATLQMPDTVGAGKVAAIVLLHGSGGIDGRGAFHARALNEAGFATLEVWMFAPGKRPKEGPAATFSHAYGALRYLAGRGDIDPGRIGVMGFSFGASVTLRTASAGMLDEFSAKTGGQGFAAHVAFYPVCSTHARITTDPAASGHGSYTRFTGKPILILAGGQDDYGDPEDCPKLVDLWQGRTGGPVELEFYPNGTHGWDGQDGREREIWDSAANRGKGAMVRLKPDPALAAASRARAVNFLKAALKP